MIETHQIINYPVPSNCFVIYNKALGDNCIIVDPGSKTDDELFAFLEKQGLAPKYIILTHEHFDHCWGVNELVDKYHIPIVCSRLCAEGIKSYKKNCSVFYDVDIRFTIETETIAVEDIEYKLDFYGTTIRFVNTPGHSLASICFIADDKLFTGDTLIKGEKTVTKLHSGSKEDLEKTMRYLKELSSKRYWVYAGHGEGFWLDEELRIRHCVES